MGNRGIDRCHINVCLLILVTFCSLLAGCGGGGLGVGVKNPFLGGNITGCVKDSDNKVIPNVQVSAGEVSAVTDRNGNFTLQQVPAGMQIVSVALSGYFDTGVGNRFITVTDGGNFSAGTFVMSKLATESVFLSDLIPQSSDYEVKTVSWVDIVNNKPVRTDYVNSLVRKTPSGGAPFMSPTTALYWLGGSYSRFHSMIAGLQDKTSTLEMVFRVYGDDRLLFESDKLKPGLKSVLDVDVTGVSVLKLEVSTVKVYWVTGDYAWYDPTLVTD